MKLALGDGGRHTPLRTGMRAFFHLGTAGRMGIVRLPPGFESLSPGAVCTMVRTGSSDIGTTACRMPSAPVRAAVISESVFEKRHGVRSI